MSEDRVWTLGEIEHNREVWVGGLDSGEFEQGDGYLNLDGKMCCLGVAAHLLKELVGIEVTCNPHLRTEILYDGDGILLTPGTRKALGINMSDQAMLTALNDNGAPFAAIAAMIKEMPIHLEDEEVDDLDI